MFIGDKVDFKTGFYTKKIIAFLFTGSGYNTHTYFYIMSLQYSNHSILY